MTLHFSGPLPQSAVLADAGAINISMAYGDGLVFGPTLSCNFCCSATDGIFEVRQKHGQSIGYPSHTLEDCLKKSDKTLGAILPY